MRLVSLLWFVLSGLVSATEVREEAIEHAGVKFRVVRVAPAAVRVVWNDPQGQPYRTFAKVREHFAKEGKTVKFLMNGGIFEPGGTPSGLHMEGGRTLHPLNPRAGEGNFFLKPNGVLAWEVGVKEAKPARIETTEAFFAAKPALGEGSMGVQSGPLLLIDGKRHAAFKEGSLNKLPRNGVGVDSQGRVVFAITAPGQEVSFWDFAGLFLKLECKDALFLDGDISRMETNPTGKSEEGPFGAMFMVAE